MLNAEGRKNDRTARASGAGERATSEADTQTERLCGREGGREVGQNRMRGKVGRGKGRDGPVCLPSGEMRFLFGKLEITYPSVE